MFLSQNTAKVSKKRAFPTTPSEGCMMLTTTELGNLLKRTKLTDDDPPSMAMLATVDLKGRFPFENAHKKETYFTQYEAPNLLESKQWNLLANSLIKKGGLQSEKEGINEDKGGNNDERRKWLEERRRLAEHELLVYRQQMQAYQNKKYFCEDSM